jgi:hypothetical protein
MDDEGCVSVPYTDVMAERTQAYMWLLDTLSGIGRHNYPQNSELIREGLEMLMAVRRSIETPSATVLKGIRGGK